MSLLSHGPRTPEAAAAATCNDPEVARLRDELGRFELGRFLLDNLGLDGRWTSYILMFPERGARTGLSSDGTALSDLESWLLSRCPIVLATQQRFQLMREQTQALLRPGMALASLPCGAMDDLLSLDLTGISGLRLSGVDLDPAALRLARHNHARLNPAVSVEFEQRDAWDLGCRERWDLVTSNGLNIYVADDARCTAFYRCVAEALRPGGVFLISFITPPPQWRPQDSADLERQRQLFQEVVPVRWSAHRDEATTRAQLQQAGFEVLSLHHDAQRMFPVMVARRRPRP